MIPPAKAVTAPVIPLAHELSDRVNYGLMDLLSLAAKREGSDVHLKVGLPPTLRVHGKLWRADLFPLSPEMIETLLTEILTEPQLILLRGGREVDFACEISGQCRFRGNAFSDNGGFAAVFRVIKSAIPTIDGLGLPPVVREFAQLDQGLVLVTGPTGCGKSTTLAAMVHLINQTMSRHIISIEDPIEFLYQPRLSIISQRELGRHTPTFASALRSALREDPDVLLVGEMRDRDTISLAITAAETGHLVLSTLHTNSAIKTIDRIIDAFGAAEERQIRAQLAELLQAVISQRLVPTLSGNERLLAVEILRANSAVKNLIREGKTHQILSIMQTSRDAGMCTLDNSLLRLLKNKRITAETACAFAGEKKLFGGGDGEEAFHPPR